MIIVTCTDVDVCSDNDLTCGSTITCVASFINLSHTNNATDVSSTIFLAPTAQIDQSSIDVQGYGPNANNLSCVVDANNVLSCSSAELAKYEFISVSFEVELAECLCDEQYTATIEGTIQA